MKKTEYKLLLVCCIVFALLAVFAFSSCDNNPDVNTDTDAIENFTITFSQGDGYPDVIKTVAKGETLIEIPAPKKVTGYNLAWEDKDLTNIQGNITVSIVKTPIKYSINYMLNGGTNNENNINVYDINTAFTFLKPTKNDFDFKGWFTDEALTAPIADIVKGTTGEITLYAKWEATNKVKVTFDTDGGNIIAPQDIAVGNKATEPQAPTKDGYTFDGWYIGSEKWSFIGYSVTEPITLTAKWIANENTLIFDGNGATNGNMPSMKILTDAAPVLPQNIFEKMGYTFIGWSTNKNGSVEYEDCANYIMGSKKTYKLYAIWQANENTIVFNGNGATSGSIDNVTAKTDEVITLPNNPFEKQGYKFLCWTDGFNTYEVGEEYTVGVNGTINLYAAWQANTNKLIFDGNGASGSMSEMEMKTDETVALPENTFVKENYRFIGWSTTPNGEVEYRNKAFYKMGTESTYTLYAMWGELDSDGLLADVMNQYEGKTVNILAPIWSNGVTGAPWSQVELCVTDWDKNANGFGTKINNGVMERQEYIENTYGVSINWINCQGASMRNRLTEAAMSKGTFAEETIHIALPYVYEAMSLVYEDALYSIGSDYVRFNEEYYNQDSIQSYTLSGNTFFVGGDISFLDNDSAYVIFFNNDMAEKLGDTVPNVYDAALNGTWTIDTLYSIAGMVSENLDGKNEYTDKDKYGFGTTQIASYYQYFGVYQVGKGRDSGNNEVYGLTIENENVNTIIEKMLFAKKNTSFIRTNWTSGFGAMQTAFEENRLLFYNEGMQKLYSLDRDTNVGVLPFPKLTVGQDRYYTPVNQMATVACVPRATDDRTLSECMIEILSKTASDYIMTSYYDKIEDALSSSDNYEKSLKIIKEEINPNLMYDLGYMYGKYAGDGNGLITSSVQATSIDGNTNNFNFALIAGRTQAETELSKWSLAYRMYQD